ncbi:UDP-2,4-diacetamido-2,4,6-trideoxy-beta-L-altropyranose hydrolase [Shewanella sp. ULN5]|nr:UDP-2,4-diacetamido-2,4,6-trideoxy-beta-L-altropyranose hydrolase [Shewanella sp. ULN5]MDP5144996.1 UDP-2,4-diacetamido-2,4,6-trideoxy-beta-L-altropyranose hydrolase [Shewanella sp. ULN5]
MFRTDSSHLIGYGHLMRCLTLAHTLKQYGCKCFFICRNLANNQGTLITQQGFELVLLPQDTHSIAVDLDVPQHGVWLETSWQQDITQCIPFFISLKPDIIILDHYALDAKWEVKAKTYCNKLMVIDDLADRKHQCDILLDYNLNVAANAYQALVPKQCQLLLGGKYVLLRDEFKQWQYHSIRRRNNNRLETVLIIFGGLDTDNNSERVLQLLKNIPALALKRIDLVVSANAPHFASLNAAALCMPTDTRIHTNASNMAELMANADLAIGSGGGSTFERLFLKLPSLLTPIADNQIAPLLSMSKSGFFEMFRDFNELAHLLTRFCSQPLPLVSAPVLFGAPLVCQTLLARDVTLADVKPLDIRRTFHWLQSDKLRQQFVQHNAPVRASHFVYWRALLKSRTQYTFSIIQRGKHVGNLGVKHVNVLNNEAELWIYIGEQPDQKKGLGTTAMTLLEAFIKQALLIDNIVIHVEKDNHAALSFYDKLGYVASSDNLVAPEFANKNVQQLRKAI